MGRISLFVCCLFLATLSYAQSYDACLNFVKENKYHEAIEGLENLQKYKESKMSASLLLAIIKADEENFVGAFDDFKIFYNYAPDPYPFFYALSNSGIFNVTKSISGNEVKDFLEKVLRDDKADPAVKLIATDLLAKSYNAKGDFSAVRKIYANSGALKNWATVGVFENVSGSGFNKDFGVLGHPETNHPFINKVGTEVKWFDIVSARNDQWYDFNYHYNIDNSIIYAQTFINSDEDKEVLMKVGVSGSFKVWLNDFQVGGENEERNTDADVYVYKVKLQKGTNRLLLQLGSSEINQNNFMVRIFDTEDQPIKNVASVSQYKPYEKAKPYIVGKIPFSPEQFFEEYLDTHPTDMASKIMLLNIYYRNGKKFAAHKLLADLKKNAQHCTLLSEMALNIAKIDNNILAESKEKESIKTNDPESVAGLNYRYEEAISKERWDDAIALVNHRITLYGENVNSALKLINVYVNKKDNEKVISEVNKAYDKYPNSAEVTSYKYLLIVGGSKDLRTANNILTTYLKTNYDERIVEQVVGNDFKIGARDEGKQLFRNVLDNDPIATVLFCKYAEALYDMHDYKEAYDMIDRAIALSPYIGWNYFVKGLIYNTNDKKDEAIEMMKKSIAYSPTNYTVRKKLRELQGKKDLADFFIQNNIEDLYKNGRENTGYDKEDAVCLLNEKRKIVYPEHGAVTDQTELLFLIKSKAAIEQLKEYNISYNSFTERLIVEKAEVLKKDGNKVAAERQNGHCVFSSLEVGDAIHLSYKLEESYEGKLAEHFWENFYFNNAYPVKISRFSLIVPSEKKFSYKVVNTQAQARESIIDEYKMYVWEENDIPKVTPEQGMPNSVLEQLLVSSVPDWNYVANWYSDITNNKTEPDYEVKEKVKELMAGHSKLPDIEKAHIIYNYIEENYHYSNVPFLHSALTPQRASRTLSTKLGDCKDLSTLFVSMAKEAGLDANLVLVSTRENDANNFLIPNIGFNHCIARLRSNNKDYLIELTDNYLPFSAMGYQLINANGLFIPKNGGTDSNAAIVKLNTDHRPQNINIRNSELSFKDDQATIHRQVLKIGSESANMRQYYIIGTDEDRTKKLKADINREFNKDLKIGSATFSDMNSLSDTMHLDYNFTIDNYTSTIVGMSVFKLPWTESYPFSQIFSLEKRKYPMDLWLLAAVPYSKETITVSLPAGKKLVEDPQNVSISCGTIRYSVKYEVKGNKITATRELNFLKDVVSPGEYEETKAFISKIGQADTKEIAFK